MSKNNFRHSKGFTLIEATLATVMVVIAIMGAASYRYYATCDARKADAQIGATRLASLLLEGWKATGGQISFDPAVEYSSQLSIKAEPNGPAIPAGFTKLGIYKINSDDVSYYAAMSYKLESANVPRTLNIDITCLGDYQIGVVSAGDPSVKLTTYTGS